MVRTITWVKAALKDFQDFPEAVQDQVVTALRFAARGEKVDKAKPMTGLGSGVFEIAVAYRGNAYRAVYAVQIGEDLWVVHAFQKKSKTGIKTPKPEIDLIRERIARIKEQ
ncbi:MAG: type II toxin-antitoxin system RelE/ParE family toxin [Candidatus Tectimicrobiota bacterium]